MFYKQKPPYFKIACSFFIFFQCLICFSQPVIDSFVPLAAPVGATVTLTGTNFNTVAANNIVYFGATKANVLSATATSISVIVPAGSEHGVISLSTGNYIAFSKYPFTLISGTTVTTGFFDSKIDFISGNYPASIMRKDFDGDGKPDMVVSNYTSNSISVFKNNSTPCNVSFAAAITYVTNLEPEGIKTEDINNDGKPDIIVNSISNHLFSVLINTSTINNISFGPPSNFNLGNNYWPRAVTIADIDGDGMADVVTPDNNKIIDFINNTSHGTVSISRNTGTSNLLSFAAPVSFNTGDYPRSTFVMDLDGDTKPDIASANSNGNDVTVYRNNSSLGNINLILQQTLPLTGLGEKIIIYDIDGDLKPELVVTTHAGVVTIFKNNSTAGAINFSTALTFATGGPIGVTAGDIDGDGKADLAVANLTGNVSFLKNTSTQNNISFAPKIDFKGGTTLLDVKIGDVDGDNLPDLTVTNAPDNLVSVLRTSSPTSINLGSDKTICEGDSVVLSVNINSAEIIWSTGEVTKEITVKRSEKIWVRVNVNLCFALTDTIQITVNSAPKRSLGKDTVLCKGAVYVLDAYNSGASYLWDNGNTSSSFTVKNAGTYFVAVNIGGCIKKDTIVIQYDSIPLFSLGPDIFLCPNQQIILNPNIFNANFLWQDGTTSSTFTIKKQGYYKLTISNQCGSAFDEILITEGSCSLFVPSAFSPNDDRLNDIFKPIVYGQLIAYEFDVFDRWGNQVFHSTNAADGWDGKVKGNHYKPGVFIWQCRFQLFGKPQNFKKGTVTLIR